MCERAVVVLCACLLCSVVIIYVLIERFSMPPISYLEVHTSYIYINRRFDERPSRRCDLCVPLEIVVIFIESSFH